MSVTTAMSSDMRYVLNLVQAGVDGVISARKLPTVTVNPVWGPMALGAVVGASAACLVRRRKSGYDVAVGGVVGSVVGMGCALAWASRGVMAVLARGAIGRINTVRDAHWLAANPIDYA